MTGAFGTALARARSHLFPNSSLVESWLGFGPLKEWVGRPQHTCTHKRGSLCVPCGGSSCVSVVDLFLSCTCAYPTWFFCVLLCVHHGILCGCTLFSTLSRWLCRSVPACCRLRLRFCGLRPASTRVEPQTKESNMSAHFCC